MNNSSLKPRVIARLDIKNGNLIKTIQLEGLRKLGDPQEFANRYYKADIDEIIIIDMVASLYGRNNSFSIVEEIVKECFVPVTIGGGIRSLADAETAFRVGADKIAINTAAFKNLEFMEVLVENFGSQAIIGSIQAKKNNHGGWSAFSEAGRTKQEDHLISWIKKLEAVGVGELLVTSIDKEGTKKGFDLELMKLVSSRVDIPVIASGGCGSISHIKEVVSLESNDGIAIAGAFHYGIMTPSQIKAIL